ncbi:hypothetical protein ACQCN2_11860 [Brevibacillus ginsengisoli]|uniref:hypothetical protein n=1 Tax=Brevibacillus ginsengisoli TaxID=363854 RepID=UPI003CEAFA7A
MGESGERRSSSIWNVEPEGTPVSKNQRIPADKLDRLPYKPDENGTDTDTFGWRHQTV